MPSPGSAPIVAGILARLRSVWRGLRKRDELEREMVEEFRHHLEMRTADLMGRGLSSDAALRQARLEFGNIGNHKTDARASRGLRPFDEVRLSTLDAKLGVRMIAKHRGLSLVSLIGMSVAITIGTTALSVISTLSDPSIPLSEGEQLVSIRNWDIRSNTAESRLAHDLTYWKSELKTVRELGAFQSDFRNLIVPGATPQVVRVASMSASGFRIARVAPVIGRPLIADDERADAAPVVVIAHEEWERRFDGDSGILGRSVRLGNSVHTIVGVMPAGFRFPVNHRYWVPMQLNTAALPPNGGPSVSVFGRLGEGVSIDEAQVELTTIGLRLAASFPATHQYLRPRATPYAYPFLALDTPMIRWALRSARVAIGMLLLLIAVNVAVLIYARTASRTGEIALRTALGASRHRIITQLFVEALALSAIAAAVGLTISSLGLGAAQDYLWPASREEFPFWIDFAPSPMLVAYAIGLAVATAVVVGVFPALKATGRGMQRSLQQLSSRGSQTHLGRTWTALIIGQVAIAVAILPTAAYFAGELTRRVSSAVRYPAHELLRARLGVEVPGGMTEVDSSSRDQASAARFVTRGEELLRRLRGEPGVTGVAFVSQLPGYPFRRIETERGETQWAFIQQVSPDFFGVMDVRVAAGRDFVDADAQADARAGAGVIVNRVFAERVLGTGNVIGRRVRMVSFDNSANSSDSPERARGPWLEVIGVVPDFTTQGDLEPPHARLYTPATIATHNLPVTIDMRVRGSSPLVFASRLREIAAAVDPTLQLHAVRTADDAERQVRRSLGLIAAAITAVVVSVVLLSAAGIYAMMSFTVVRRRREIGIRSALGADPRRLLASVFARAGGQLSIGVLIGLTLAVLVRGPIDGKGWFLLPLVGVLMAVVGLLAAIGPARQGLAIPPTEALRDE